MAKETYALGGLVIVALAIIGYRFSGFYKLEGVTSIPEGTLNIAIAGIIVIIIAALIAVVQMRKP